MVPGDPILQVQLLVLALLMVASIVAIVVRRFRIPYTVALVLAGVALTLNTGLRIDLSSKLILSLFVPPLVFEAAFHLNLDLLRRNIGTIVLFAVPGVILTMLFVGGVVAIGAGLPISIALVFGALIAATDPVAVTALFRKLGAPNRLTVLLEGESLLNDGTAIVIFELAVVAALTGYFNLMEGVFDFVRVGGGGIVTGLALGWFVARLIAKIDDHLVVTTLTTVLAFGAYIIAEEFLHFSGLLAVVAAGIITGNMGPRGMSPTSRIVVFNFWEYTAFLANSAVFLLIGSQVDIPQLYAHWQTIIWAIAAVLASRAVVIYLLSRLGQEIPANWRHVLFWGGLRGAITLALALSLPAEIGPERATVTAMAFGVVLFTLVAQGISMDWLVNRLQVIFRSEEQMEYERRHARALAARAGYEHLQKLHNDGLISSHTWENISQVARYRMEALAEAVQETLHGAPELEIQELTTARHESLRAQRGLLSNLRRDGVISDEVYEELVPEIDAALDSDVELWPHHLQDEWRTADICQLLMAVVESRDLENAVNALTAHGIPSTHIQSRGSLLSRADHLLLVGISPGRLEEGIEALRTACRGRVDYRSKPFDTMGLPMTVAKPVQVQGAAVFVFDVDRCEVI